MKNLKFIIFVLAGTIIVACSKKKDGGEQPPVAYPINGVDQGYVNYGQNNLNYAQMYPTNLNCRNGTPQMFYNPADYCDWLYNDARLNCEPHLVKREFQVRCMHLAATYNFCMPRVGGYTYYSSSGSYGSSRSSRHGNVRDDGRVLDFSTRSSNTSSRTSSVTSIDRPTYSSSGTEYSESTRVIERPSSGVYPRETVRPSNSQVVESRPSYGTKTKCVERIVETKSVLKLGSSKNNKNTFGKDCLVDLINESSCKQSSATTGTHILKSIPKISDRNDLKKVESAAQMLVLEAEKNNLVCKIDGRRTNVSYQKLLEMCEVGTAPIVKQDCYEVEAAPVAQTAPAVTQPVSETVPGHFENVVDTKNCINLEEIHNQIKNPANDLVSYSTQLIVSPLHNGLSLDQKSDIASAVYGKPFGSTAYSATSQKLGSPSATGSALGYKVIQLGDSLTINNLTGKIKECLPNGKMYVDFTDPATKQVFNYSIMLSAKAGAKFEGELTISSVSDAEISGQGATPLETLSYVIWRDRAEVEAVQNSQTKNTLDKSLNSMIQLQARVLLERIMTANGYKDLKDLQKNTFEIILNGNQAASKNRK